MKIAFIGQKGIPAKIGGVERHVEELAVRLAGKGHDVFVYVRNNYTDGNMREYKGVKLVRLPSIATKHLDAISHTFLATIHSFFGNYDIIHYQGIGPGSLSFLVKIFSPKTSLVATYHCQDYFHQKWGLLAQAYLKFGEFVISTVPDKTIAVSNNLKSFLEKKFKKEVSMIPNGFATFEGALGRESLEKWGLESGEYILSVSRLIRHKGIHYLIEAFKKIKKEGRNKNKKLVIAGEGAFTDDYVLELKKMGAGDEDIVFTGHVSGKPLGEIISNAYLFVHPSESEGLSITLLEAMGYGKAVLASDIPENLEAQRGTGFNFKSGNVEDLSRQLSFLVSDAESVRTAGMAAKRVAEEIYDWDRITGETDSLYRNLARNKF